MTGPRDDLDLAIQALIEQGAAATGQAGADQQEFGALALRLFAYQYEHNTPYRRFCRARGAEPGRVADWTGIPPVPLTAFKELTLACEPPEEAAAVFMTSGSTDPARRGRHHHPHLQLYDASLREGFAHWFLPDRARMRTLVLGERPQAQPHSSIAYFFSRLVDFFGAPGSDWFVDAGGLATARLTAALSEAEASGEPVALLGTSFAYVHLLDALTESGRSFALPAGSRVLDTGGFKGRSREVSPEQLRAALGARLGVPDAWCVNYYGMTEISTQYYDTTLRDTTLRDTTLRDTTLRDTTLLDTVTARPPTARRKAVPAWARIQVIDPETRRPVPDGEDGLIVHHDLANRGSCAAVLSEDVGHLVPTEDAAGGPQDFVLIGRASGSEARGCSLALDEFLTATGTRR